jgi:hypothetical protein
MTLTKAEQAEFYVRLCRHLLIPGRIDELIMLMSLDPANLPGPGAAPAQVARVIFELLNLRVPPELELLATMIQGWETPRLAPIGPTAQDEARRHPPTIGPAQKIAVLWPQILAGLGIIYLIFAAILLALGRPGLAVTVLSVLGTMTTAIVLGCIGLAQGVRSIPEAQFQIQAHEGRMQYIERGLLARGGQAA